MKLISIPLFDKQWIMLLLIGLSLLSAPSLSSAITVGEHYRGGIVFYVDGSGEHGLVAAKTNIEGKSHGRIAGNFTWYDAKAACEKFASEGYNDWFLPNAWQLHQLYLQRNAVGGLGDHFYWSSSRDNGDNGEDGWYQNFFSGDQNHENKVYNGRVRPVRSF